MEKTKVSLVECSSYEEVDPFIDKAVDLVGGLKSYVKPGETVWVKLNGSIPDDSLPTMTDPRFIGAVVRLLRKKTEAGEILVGDSPVGSISDEGSRGALDKRGYGGSITKSVEEAGGTIVYLDETPHISVKIPTGRVLKEVYLPKLVFDTDVLINVPKWKTHLHTNITICIKNFHGLVSYQQRYLAHFNMLSQKLVDLLKVVKPALNIVDGIVGMEGYGPTRGGTPKEIGLIAAGKDPVAVDAVCSKIMGYDPMFIDTTRIADYEKLGVGNLDKIQVVGKPLSDINIPFNLPNQKLRGVQFPNVELYLGDMCYGCQGSLKRVLQSAKDQGKLDNIEPITIVCGIDAPIPEIANGKLAIVGDCTLLERKRIGNTSSIMIRQFNETRIEGKTFIAGCPLNTTTLLNTMFSTD